MDNSSANFSSTVVKVEAFNEGSPETDHTSIDTCADLTRIENSMEDKVSTHNDLPCSPSVGGNIKVENPSDEYLLHNMKKETLSVDTESDVPSNPVVKEENLLESSSSIDEDLLHNMKKETLSDTELDAPCNPIVRKENLLESSDDKGYSKTHENENQEIVSEFGITSHGISENNWETSHDSSSNNVTLKHSTTASKDTLGQSESTSSSSTFADLIDTENQTYTSMLEDTMRAEIQGFIDSDNDDDVKTEIPESMEVKQEFDLDYEADQNKGESVSGESDSDHDCFAPWETGLDVDLSPREEDESDESETEDPDLGIAMPSITKVSTNSQPPSLQDRISYQEAMICSFIAEHSLSPSVAPHLISLAQTFAKDEKALNFLYKKNKAVLTQMKECLHEGEDENG